MDNRCWGGLRIDLALSGGAARGFAHIGVLKVFEREGVPVSMIAGTSSRAIVGAMYASGVGIERMEEIALKLDWIKDIVQPALPKDGLLSLELK